MEKVVERIQLKEIPVIETEERVVEVVREIPVEIVKEVPVYIKVREFADGFHRVYTVCHVRTVAGQTLG